MQVGHRFSVLVGVVEVRGGAGRGGAGCVVQMHRIELIRLLSSWHIIIL